MFYKQLSSLFFIVFFLLAALAGCVDSGKYGKFRPAGRDMTIEHLVKHWEDYNVYWAGVSVRLTNAILFDPKEDDLTFSPQRFWDPVDTEAELSEVMRWINNFGAEPPSLYRVIGPGDRTFGYLYMLPTSPLIRVVDERTLAISNISERGSIGIGAQ